MKSLGHLVIEDLTLQPGQEWCSPGDAWSFLLIRNGVAYWLSHDLNRSLAEGEMLIVPPAVEGSVRASQLNEVLLQGFRFAPSLLCGFFTVAERHFFEAETVEKAAEVRFLPSTHPATQRFKAMRNGSAREGSLAERAEALGLVTAVFEDQLVQHQPPAKPAPSAGHRFDQIIAQMPDTEMINHSPEQLARLCGCSPRHFNRLFHQHFGTSARARQTELRLLKARQLLGSTDEKIINIALDSGYRNLSLFNSLFKRRFGMTPSECRRKAARRNATLSILLALVTFLGVFCTTAVNAAPGDQGFSEAVPAAAPTADSEAIARARSALRKKLGYSETDESVIFVPAPSVVETNTASPAAASTHTQTFEVKGYEVRGNTVLTKGIITPILQKHTGLAVTIDGIRQGVTNLTMAYRDRGFVSVVVGLPPQQLTNGIVKVQVTEGRLAEINVINNRFFSSNNVMRELPSLQTNMILNALVFQQELDRANGNRDRQIYPVISPGPEPGTSVLDLKVKDRLPLHAHFDLNNYSTPHTPQLRANFALVDNNLWQRNHQAGLQYSFTPEDYKQGSYYFFDQPLIANYSAFYRLPFSGVNGAPNEHEYAVSDFGYDEATRRFRAPPPSGTSELLFFASRSLSDTGTQVQQRTLTPNPLPPEGGLQIENQILNQTLNPNEDLGTRYSAPFAQIGKLSSTVSAGLDFKNYRSTLIQENLTIGRIFIPAFGSNGPPWDPPGGFQSPPVSASRTVFTSVQYLPFSLSWDGSILDKSGVTSFLVGESFNLGFIGDKADFQQILGSTYLSGTNVLPSSVNGRYFVVTAGLTREQKLVGDWGLRLHADGQWADQPLISNEQFALGGQAGVRGYREGTEYGDRGWRVQFEPRSPYVNVGLVFDKVPMVARFYGFVDYGERYLIEPSARKRRQDMLGTGAGLDVTIGEHFDFRLMLGVPLIDTPAQKSGYLRGAFSISVQL